MVMNMAANQKMDLVLRALQVIAAIIVMGTDAYGMRTSLSVDARV